ncbi:peptidoglycan-binding domain-containing protein [Luteimicrobium xylanilyticum]
MSKVRISRRVVALVIVLLAAIFGGIGPAAAVTISGPGAAVAATSGYLNCEGVLSYMIDGAEGDIPWEGSASGTGWCTMYEGMNDGSDSYWQCQWGFVCDLQYTLNTCYGRSIAEDGSFGPATKAALQYAQGKAGVSKDGIFGPATRSAMLWANWQGVCLHYHGQKGHMIYS